MAKRHYFPNLAWPIWANGYTAANLPDLKKWERFQVWMRKAGLPNFRKLWGRQDEYSMDVGLYEVDIVDCKF
jgi:hypothetical protein